MCIRGDISEWNFSSSETHDDKQKGFVSLQGSFQKVVRHL